MSCSRCFTLPRPAGRGNDGSCVLRDRRWRAAHLILSRRHRGDGRNAGCSGKAGEDLRRRSRSPLPTMGVVPRRSLRSSNAAASDATSVFSVRYANAWNLPDPEVLERYRARGDDGIHRTDAPRGGRRGPSDLRETIDVRPLASRPVLERALTTGRGRRTAAADRAGPSRTRVGPGGPTGTATGIRYTSAGGTRNEAPDRMGCSRSPFSSPRSSPSRLFRARMGTKCKASASACLDETWYGRRCRCACGRLLAPLSLPYAAAVGIRRALIRGGCGRLVEWACRWWWSATSRSAAPARHRLSSGSSAGCASTDSAPECSVRAIGGSARDVAAERGRRTPIRRKSGTRRCSLRSACGRVPSWPAAIASWRSASPPGPRAPIATSSWPTTVSSTIASSRDVEIAVLDGERRHGTGWCLPAGPLREPVSRLDSVDFVVTKGHARGKGSIEWTSRGGRSVSPRTTPLPSIRRRSGRARSTRWPGSATPASVLSAASRTLGLRIVPRAFPDHHPFASRRHRFLGRAAWWS